MNNHNRNCGGNWKVETNGGDEDPLYTTTLSIDETFAVLAHPERRTILRYLMDAPENSIPIHDLIRHVNADCTGITDDPTTHDSIATRIYHSHIPKFVDLGIIEYDDRSKEVRYYRDERLESWLRNAITGTNGST